ncbi:amidohydrolase family protein [Caballeronia sp. DA-9]|uniref:amidohydrolase family protein n=1 Tax=Caballeronia sp. DA-9 TaxID=3436237 RepID=UPI003F66DB17
MSQDISPPPHIPVRPDWLSLHVEEALEPSLPIIDSHHHLWQFPDKTYRSTDLLHDLASGHNVRATVFIECQTCYRTDGPPEMASLGEIEFVLEEIEAARKAASRTRVAAAMVGHADLLLGARVTPVLEELIRCSEGRMKSIRNIGVWHADPTVRASVATPPPHLLMDPRFREGVSRLAPLGLSFDAWVVHTQLEELRSLAGAFPDTPMVLNHVGGPLGIGPYHARRDEVFRQWRTSMLELARYPNVHIKLGGFGMTLFGFDFYNRPRPPSSAEVADVIRPYVETCVEAFGARRCMFESNFPVDKGNIAYGVLWNAYKRVAAQASVTEKADLFHDTAARFYRIEAI